MIFWMGFCQVDFIDKSHLVSAHLRVKVNQTTRSAALASAQEGGSPRWKTRKVELGCLRTSCLTALGYVLVPAAKPEVKTWRETVCSGARRCGLQGSLASCPPCHPSPAIRRPSPPGQRLTLMPGEGSSLVMLLIRRWDKLQKCEKAS